MKTGQSVCVWVFMLVLLSGQVIALFTGIDANNNSFTIINADFDFLVYNYSLSSQVYQVTINTGCVAANLPAAGLFAYVHWPSAVQQGCKYFSDVVVSLTTSSAVPLVAIFSTTSKVHVGYLTDPYEAYPLVPSTPSSPLNPHNTPIFLTLVSLDDDAALMQMQFPLSAQISSNPSLDTLELYSPSFMTPYWVLFAVYLLLMIYCAFEMILLSYLAKRFLVNLRTGMYMGIFMYGFCRVVVYGRPEFFGFYGRYSGTATNFLWYFAFFSAYVAISSILLAWSSIAIKELKMGKTFFAYAPFVVVYFSIGVFVLLVIFNTLQTTVPVFVTATLITALILAPLILIEAIFFGIYGTRLLVSLTKVSSGKKNKGVILRKITILMLTAVVAMIYFVIIMVSISTSAFNFPNSHSILSSFGTAVMMFDWPMFVFAVSICISLYSNSFGSGKINASDSATKSPPSTDRKPTFSRATSHSVDVDVDGESTSKTPDGELDAFTASTSKLNSV